jgi:hypothetical protein
MKQRDSLIDFLRFVAIFLMIYAHSNMILGIEGIANKFLENTGNFICFAIFLFCYGASTFYQKQKKSFSYEFKRIALLYFAYFIISITIWINSGTLDLVELGKYLILLNLPEYSEFIIAFIIFEIIYFFLKQKFDLVINNILILIIVSLISFIVANILNLFDYGFLNPYLALIWGKENYFSFPIMQYFLFFLLGQFYAKNLSKESVQKKKSFAIKSIAILGMTFAISYFLNPLILRWPPNINFILGNLLIILIFVLVYLVIPKSLQEDTRINKFLRTINKYTIHILYTHLAILYIFKWLGISEHWFLSIVSTFGIIIIFLLLDKLKSNNAKSN